MFIHTYDRVIAGLATIAALMVISVFVFIILDVSLRTTGFRPPEFVSAVSEYLILYATMFIAPWLVRERGHVRIGSFLSFVPSQISRLVEQAILVLCCGVCVIAAYLACQLGIDCWQRGLLDIRSIAVPRWLLFLPLVLGFGLCAVEFLRIVILGQGFDKDEGLS